MNQGEVEQLRIHASSWSCGEVRGQGKLGMSGLKLSIEGVELHCEFEAGVGD